MNSRNSMAAKATLHCLTGCAIGEIVGLMIGTAWATATVSESYLDDATREWRSKPADDLRNLAGQRATARSSVVRMLVLDQTTLTDFDLLASVNRSCSARAFWR